MEPPPPLVQPALTPLPISDALLRAVYTSDQDMYPAAGLSYARLRAWVDACPDLSVCFCLDQPRDSRCNRPSRNPSGAGSHGTEVASAIATAAAVVGVVIVLPLRKRCWEDLLRGRLKEWEIEPASMFPGASAPAGGWCGRGGGDEQVEGLIGTSGDWEEEIGLHVYHIERFGETEFNVDVGGRGTKERRRFSEFALQELMRRVRVRSGWRVAGMSALTATSAGRRTFERLGFAPTGYRELFVEKGTGEGPADAKDTCQTEMICLYSSDKAEAGEAAGGNTIVSMSEMVVKYGTSLNLV